MAEEGTIARLRPDRGFGFLRPATGGEDLFFHASEVQGAAIEDLQAGQRVTFTRGTDPRNPARARAEAVRLAEAVAGN
jgi:CspA family cold shock protein